MKKAKSILALILSVLMLASCFVTASAAEIEETEPNNSPETANMFDIGKKIEGSLSSADDVDFLAFKATKTGLATVKFEHPAVTGAEAAYFDVSIYNAAGVLVSAVSSAGNIASVISELIVNKDEVYLVKVDKSMVYDSKIGYAVSVTIDSSISTESEPNSTLDKADTLAVSVPGSAKNYYGFISSATDRDFYSVKVPSNGVINLYLYNDFTPKGNFTATLREFTEGADGIQVAEVVTEIAMSDIEESKIGPSVCVEAGDYILEIEGVNGGTGSYKTRVYFRDVDNTETENNDSLLQADEISIDKTYKATLDEAADRDYFKFTAAAGNYGYDINFKATNNAKWNVRVLDSDGVAIADPLKVIATDSSKTDKLETKALTAGVYFIEVTAGEKHDSDIYEIKITAKPKPEEPEKKESLWDRIAALDWGGLWDNFSEWIGEINILGMLTSFVKTFALLFKTLG